MDLTDKDLDEYRRLYKKRFGKTITREEAREQGSSLLRLMKVVYKPVTQEQVDDLAARDKKAVEDAYDYIFEKTLNEASEKEKQDDDRKAKDS